MAANRPPCVTPSACAGIRQDRRHRLVVVSITAMVVFAKRVAHLAEVTAGPPPSPSLRER
ncbi:hypothetical protein GCM10027074_19630 [Streptomyces deserti]